MSEGKAASAERWRWPIRLAIIVAGLALSAAIALTVMVRWWPEWIIARATGSTMAFAFVALVADEKILSAVVAADKRLTELAIDTEPAAIAALGGHGIVRRGVWRMIANLHPNTYSPWRRESVRSVLATQLEQDDPSDRRAARAAYCYGSAVDIGLLWLRSSQSAEGSWPKALSPIAPGYVASEGGVTALATLALLGAGYDHRMPSTFKKCVVRAVDWLRASTLEEGGRSEDPRDAALILTALAEAYAMSNDPALKPVVLSALARVTERIVPEVMPDDPIVALVETMALKSAMGAGLNVGPAIDHRRNAVRVAWPSVANLAARWRAQPGLTAATDGDAAGVLGLILIFTGERPGSARLKDVAAHLAPRSDLTGWSPLGTWSGYLAAFIANDPIWHTWQAPIRDAILDTQVLGAAVADGCWDTGVDEVGDKAALTAVHLMTLEVYYRYR